MGSSWQQEQPADHQDFYIAFNCAIEIVNIIIGDISMVIKVSYRGWQPVQKKVQLEFLVNWSEDNHVTSLFFFPSLFEASETQ